MSKLLERVHYGKIIIAIITMLMIGTPYLWSLFAGAVEREFLWTRAQTSMVFTASIISLIAGGILGGFITGRRSPSVTLCYACALTLGGYCTAVLINSSTLFFIAYGIAASIGLGMAYNATMAGFADCIPGRSGLCNGILLMAYAFCSMLFSPLVRAALQTFAWRHVFIAIGCISAAWMLIASFFVFRPEKSEQKAAPSNIDVQASGATLDIPPKEMIRRKTAQRYLLWGTFAASGGLSVIGQGLQIMEETGSTAALATVCVSAISLTNGLSRFFAGALWDLLGWKKVMRLATALNIAGGAGVVLGVLLRQPIVLLTGSVLAAASYGTGTPIGASFVRKFYGKKYFASNYGFINLVGLSASLLGTTMVGVLRTGSGSYLLPACLLLLYAIAAVPVLSAIKEP